MRSFSILAAAAAMALVGVCASAQAAIVPVASRAALNDDLIQWSDTNGWVPATSYPVTSNGGLSATVSKPVSDPNVMTIQLASLGSDLALFSDQTPITITFASPVAAAGTQIISNVAEAYGGTMSAYSTTGTFLGSADFSGLAGVPTFVGLKDDSGSTIGKITFDMPTTAVPNSYFINQVSLSTVPEPVSLGLLGLGAAALLRRRRATKA